MAQAYGSNSDVVTHLSSVPCLERSWYSGIFLSFLPTITHSSHLLSVGFLSSFGILTVTF